VAQQQVVEGHPDVSAVTRSLTLGGSENDVGSPPSSTHAFAHERGLGAAGHPLDAQRVRFVALEDLSRSKQAVV